MKLFNTLLAGSALAAGAYCLAPGPLAAVYDWINTQTRFTPESCAVAPVACFAARERNLGGALDKLREARMQAEGGLRVLDAEEVKEKELLDANTGLQAILRTRSAEMIRQGAASLDFQGRTYSRADAEQQAALLVREESGFRTSLASFATRRARLDEARMAAVVEENRVSGALATLTAEKAIVVATGSIEHASRLLEDTGRVESRADEVSDAVVRSTREMTPLAPPSAVVPVPGFNFDAWVGGTPSPAQREQH